MSPDDYKAWAGVKPLGEVPETSDIGADLLKLMGCPHLASRRWIWEQYDQQVGGDTVQRPGGDSAVVRVHGTDKALAITTDCTPRYCYADPYEGGKQAIAEAYRNLSAVGATPLAVTNCLNFANPQRPEIMAQIAGCLAGMADACRALDFPIVSGNVSLYNESKATGGGSAILPTPAIGGVGLLKDWRKNATLSFKAEGETICLVGVTRQDGSGHLGQSLWAREIAGRTGGFPPAVDLEHELAVATCVRDFIARDLVTAVHDVSDGGVAVAVAEMALAGELGAEILLWKPFVADAFGEDQGLFVVTVRDDEDLAALDALEDACEEAGVGCAVIGAVGGDTIKFVDVEEWEADRFDGLSEVSLTDLRRAHEAFLPELMGADGALA
jgi:phosphoribosylformylglycinamidine synthase